MVFLFFDVLSILAPPYFGCFVFQRDFRCRSGLRRALPYADDVVIVLINRPADKRAAISLIAFHDVIPEDCTEV